MSARDPAQIPLLVVMIALLVAGVFGSCFAPCSWFGCMPIKDVPARCFSEVRP